ncbi:MAG: glycoside hydrolase family 5 protein [Treponema sp.]|nr:glycoside hydrolase family 5 protein [Treponema sp.]
MKAAGKTVFFIFLFFGIMFTACADGTQDTGSSGSALDFTVPAVSPVLSSPESMSTDCTSAAALAYMQETNAGINIGNSLDAYSSDTYAAGSTASETAWGNPEITQELLTATARAGFGIVRIPVTWMGHIDSKSTGYKVDKTYLARVARVVEYAHTAGLKVVINMHHDGSNSEHWLNINKADDSTASYNEVTNEYIAVWTQTASYFKNHGDYLMFEGLNEIQDGRWGWGVNRQDGGVQYGIVNKWNQAFVTAVRGTGGNNTYRYLVVAGYDTDIDLTVANLVLPSDPTAHRLIVSAHYYSPYEYTLEAQKHCWGSDYGGASASDCTNYGQEKSMEQQFAKLKTAYVDRGIPVYLGECGATYQKGYEKYRRYYMEYTAFTAHNCGIVPVYWDNGATSSGKENEGLFYRSTAQQAFPKILQAVMRGVSGETSVAIPGSDTTLDAE